MAISGVTDIVYVNNSSDQTIENFINEKFADYLTATHQTANQNVYCHIKDKDNNEIMKITLHLAGGSSAYIDLYNHSGSTKQIGIAASNSNRVHWSVYACTNGLLIYGVTANNDEIIAYITINEDGTIIYGASPSTTTAQVPTEFYTGVWDNNLYTTTATIHEAGSTSLLNLVYAGDYGVVSVAEKGYFALYAQYPHAIGVLNLNDKIYLTNGWFVIADE